MTEEKNLFNEEAGLESIPTEKRVNWLSPALVYAGCEFCIPVIMIGSGIIASFNFKEFIMAVILGLVVITWLGDGINCYLGAMTGRSSSVIARSAFGDVQARIIVSLAVLIMTGGWWALQTAVTGNALCAMFGIDYTNNFMVWAIITIIAGIIFAIPPIIGYSSMAWTDYVAVPAGMLLVIAGFYLSIKGSGWEKIWTYNPQHNMLFTQAVSTFVGANVAQFVIFADYARFCKPKARDAFLVPSGVVVTGFILFIMGAVMGVGRGTYDIVALMQQLGFGWWGFLILWLAQWTSQLVNDYSMGLSLCNMFNMKTNNQRKYLTALGTVIALIVALAGILNQFQNFLYLTALSYPAIGSILAVDYVFVNDKKWEDKKGWNWVATVALIFGIAVGYYTQYVKPWGIPAVQSYLISGLLYYVLMYVKAQIQPDQFTPMKWRKSGAINA
ncbi:purine-cytosine permease family protein [Thermoanaerobacterium sp. DL9XJH110]|uniref:purine-cytosine permease family protein n=1 Tax=Thermoanaerobacterium sp. DL9XJH110 TaxID=3386643 RepID=UPI003BB7382D